MPSSIREGIIYTFLYCIHLRAGNLIQLRAGRYGPRRLFSKILEYIFEICMFTISAQVNENTLIESLGLVFGGRVA